MSEQIFKMSKEVLERGFNKDDFDKLSNKIEEVRYKSLYGGDGNTRMGPPWTKYLITINSRYHPYEQQITLLHEILEVHLKENDIPTGRLNHSKRLEDYIDQMATNIYWSNRELFEYIFSELKPRMNF